MKIFKTILFIAVMITSAYSFGQTPVIIGNNNDCDVTAIYSIETPIAGATYYWTLGGASDGSIPNPTGQSVTVNWFQSQAGCNYTTVLVTATYSNSTTATASLDVYPCCNTGATYVFNNFTTTTSLSFVPYDLIIINGDFIMDNDVSFDNANVYVSPNSKIILNRPNITLSIINGTIITSNNCCNNMWDGIYTNCGTQTVTMQHSTIDNAQHAVNINSGSEFLIEFCEFVNNYQNININQGSGGNTPAYNGIIRGNYFVGSSNLNYPYQGIQTYSGVEAFRTYKLTIGDPANALFTNYFNNMLCGIKTEQSLVDIYNNDFYLMNLNTTPAGFNYPQLYNSTAIFCIGNEVYEPNSYYWHGANIGGSGLKSNTITNCFSGIYGFNLLMNIENNIIKTIDFANRGVNLFDNSKISDNTVEGINGGHTRFGVSISNIMPRDCKISINNNSINAIEKGITITNANTNIANNLYVNIYSNTINLDGMSYTSPTIAFSAIKAENCYGINIYDNYLSLLNTGIPVSPNLYYGIDIAQVNNGLITNNPFINKFGAGINVFGNCNFTQFYCNKIYDGYYGFLFNAQSSITSQGYAYPLANIPTDNEWFGNWNLGPTTRRLWADPAHLLTGNTRWYVRSNPPFSYQLLNPNPNPTSTYLVQANTTNTVSPCGILPQLNIAIALSANEREELYGKIVKDSNTYSALEVQYKNYDKEILYKAIKENPVIMNLGDSSDALYQDFYAEEANGNIEKIAEIEALIKDNQDSLAMLKNAELQDQMQIDEFRKQVNEIYLTTFARGNYNLTQEQIDILMPIATEYTPWEGGDAVYIARQMLNLDAETIVTDFAKAPKAIPNNAKTLNARLYPNPASTEIMIEFDNKLNSSAVFEIYNFEGLKIIDISLNKGYQFISVSTKDLKAGLYLYRISNNEKIIAKDKFLIVK